jgi:hypothetical protein
MSKVPKTGHLAPPTPVWFETYWDRGGEAKHLNRFLWSPDEYSNADRVGLRPRPGVLWP